MQRLKVILIFIIATFSSNIYCQSITHEQTRGKSIGNDYQLKELLREYFFYGKENPEIAIQIGDIYYQIGQYKEATKYYDIGFFSLPFGDARQDDVRYKKIQSFLKEGSYQKAKLEVLQLRPKVEGDKDRYSLYKGLVLYFNDEYIRGLETLQKISYLNMSDRKNLNDLCRQMVKNDKININYYQIASGAFPGLGQFFASDYKGGINSLLLNGGLVYLFFSVGRSLSFGDAILTVMPWLTRYFIGGVNNAKEAALNKKLHTKLKLINKSIIIVEEKK